MSDTEEQFVTKEEAERMIDEALLRQRLLLEKEQKERLLLSRRMEMQEELREFNGRPADRRAVQFNKDSQFDMVDFKEQMSKVFQEDGTTIKEGDAGKESIQSFMVSLQSWIKMRRRKYAAELEAYQIAKRARGGWETEKIYNESRNNFFSSSKDREWWKREEDSPAVKEKRFREAERIVLSRQEHMETDIDLIYFEDE